MLVVDDDNAVRAMIVEVLRMDPEITPIEAVHGSDAVDLAGRERPQVVVIDIMVPRMDGLEATRQIKRLARDKSNCRDRVHPGRAPKDRI